MRYLSRVFMIPLFFMSARLCASPQAPDYIIVKGDTIVTYNLLVEKYLQAMDTPDQGRLFGLSFRGISSFNCWRGYQAVYRVENDSLFLSAMLGFSEKWSGSIDLEASAQRMKEVFGDRVIQGRVFIDWFTGEISYPLNYQELRWDGVFYKIFEKEYVFSVSGGKITGQGAVENYMDDPDRIDRRDKRNLATLFFNRIKAEIMNRKPQCDCSDTYVITIDEQGDVSKVRMDYKPEEIAEYWEMEEYDYCCSTVLQAVRDMHFDILRDKGKPAAENIYVRIFITTKGEIENWVP